MPVGPRDPVLKGPVDEEKSVGPNEPPELMLETPVADMGVPEPVLMGPTLDEYG